MGHELERGEATERHTPDWILLALACVAQFMVILDVSVVNVALPSIGRDLHYSTTGLQWVVNAYVLTFAGFLLLGGRAADIYGRRRVFLFGLILFSAASLVGGFAQDSAWLTAARAVQGIGGAVLSPVTLTIIVTTFSPGPKLARALGLWGATSGAAGAAGVLLGGILTAELSWRWVLFINVPIGIAAALVAVAYLTEARGTTRQRLDIGGAITVTAGLAVLVYTIVGTDQYPWASTRTITGLIVSAVLLTGFFAWQLRSREPLVPLALFKVRSVTGGNVVMLLVGAAFFSMWYFLSLYLQDVLHFGPLRAGFAFLPMGLAIMAGAQGSSRLMSKTGFRPLLSTELRSQPGASSGSQRSDRPVTTGLRSSALGSSSCAPSGCCSRLSPPPPRQGCRVRRPVSPPACSTRPGRSGIARARHPRHLGLHGDAFAAQPRRGPRGSDDRRLRSGVPRGEHHPSRGALRPPSCRAPNRGEPGAGRRLRWRRHGAYQRRRDQQRAAASEAPAVSPAAGAAQQSEA